jgi:hypothetical protein
VHQVCKMQTWCTLDSACHWLLGVVGGPAHGPRADVVEPAAGIRPPILVAFPQRKEIPLAASQSSRNGAMVPRGEVLQKPKLGKEITSAYLAYDNKTLCQMNTCLCCFSSLNQVCIKSSQVCIECVSTTIKSAYLPCAYLSYENKKLRQMHTCMLVCMISA